MQSPDLHAEMSMVVPNSQELNHGDYSDLIVMFESNQEIKNLLLLANIREEVFNRIFSTADYQTVDGKSVESVGIDLISPILSSEIQKSIRDVSDSIKEIYLIIVTLSTTILLGLINSKAQELDMAFKNFYHLATVLYFLVALNSILKFAENSEKKLKLLSIVFLSIPTQIKELQHQFKRYIVAYENFRNSEPEAEGLSSARILRAQIQKRRFFIKKIFNQIEKEERDELKQEYKESGRKQILSIYQRC